MPVTKVIDLAYVRLQSPSLDEAEEFMTNFGTVRSERTKNALYMRGTDPYHHLHVTEQGPAKFLGIAFFVENEDDLARATKAPGASGIENIDEPGGGKRVRLKDLDGHNIELICGMQLLAPLPIHRNVLNTGDAKLRRAGELMRLPRGASQVKRTAHAVILTKDAKKKTQWYRDTLGFIPSDEVYAGTKDNVIATFNRCDRGEIYVDHHTFLCVEGPTTGLNHVSFEVQTIDDVMIGHEYLVSKKKYEHVWGIGRHVLGSQVFDYWKDPWGRVHEHWTDTDVLNNKTPPQLLSTDDGFDSQWGEAVPEAFITHATA